MSGIPFDAIAAAALSQAESLLFKWFPAGVVEGHEFRIGDIDGRPGKSLSVNLRTGAWAEFNGGIKGGDLTALFAVKFHDGKQGPAAIELAKDLGVGLNGYDHGRAGSKANGQAGGHANGTSHPAGPKPGKKSSVWQPMIPPPEHAKPPSDAAFRGFDAVYEYTDLHDRVTHYVTRRNARNGKDKEILPLTYGTLNGLEGWHVRHPAAPMPLYGLNKLTAFPDAPVLLCEGEKSADAAQTLFPEYIAMAWPRGAENVGSTDFGPLTNRRVTVWPDADVGGRKAARKIVEKLHVEFIVRTDDLADKFDAADLQVDDPAAWLAARLMKIEPPEDIEPQEDGEADKDGENDGHDGEPRRGMGLTGKGSLSGIAKAVAKLNEKYMVVSEAGKTVIYRPAYDHALKRHSYHRMSFGDFRNLYMNAHVRVGTDAEGNPTYKGVADVWLRSRDRRQYIGGITFDPRRDAPDDPETLNLWRGFAIEPKPGDWSLMQNHMFEILCRQNKEHYEHLLDRLARMFQFPGEQGQVAIVMKSGEGAGKGIVVDPLKRMLGQHAMTVTQPSHLVGHFNAHLRDCVLLFADEAFFAGDRAHNRVLKKIITDNTLEIEGKGQNVIVVPNFLHVIMASNDDWVIPASLDSRRFFVLVLSEARKGDRAYFKAIANQMEHGGGDAAMLHDLLHRDISDFDPRYTPVTEGLKQQRKLSLKTEEAWWLDCLLRGYVFRSRIGLEADFAQWYEWVSNDLLHDSYSEFAKANHERDIMSRDELGRFMKATMKCSGERPQEGIVGEHITDVESIHHGTIRKAMVRKDCNRPRGYRVGALGAARKAFEDITGLKPDWGTSYIET